MTALATAPSTTIGPVPLRQLAWVAWRRNRGTVLGLVGFLVVVAGYLVVTGLRTHAAYDDLGSCVPPITTDSCRLQWDEFMNSHGQRGLLGPLLVMLPGIIGAVVGAPLIGRELETGVFRYSWTQGAGRLRWAVAVTVPIAVLTAALMGALGVLVSWRERADDGRWCGAATGLVDVPDHWCRRGRLDTPGGQRRRPLRTPLAPRRSGGGHHVRGVVRGRVPGLGRATAPDRSPDGVR